MATFIAGPCVIESMELLETCLLYTSDAADD